MGIATEFVGTLKGKNLRTCYLRADLITGSKRRGWTATIGVYETEADAQARGEDAQLDSFSIRTPYVEGRTSYEAVYLRLEAQVDAHPEYVKAMLFGGYELGEQDES